jgi:transcriptional regulator with XRE-family HTH domain
MTKDSTIPSNLILAKNLRAKMFEKGLNARSLAIAADTGRCFIYDILKAKSTAPTITRLQKIAEVLETTIEELTGSALSLKIATKKVEEKYKVMLNRIRISMITCLGYETFSQRMEAFNQIWKQLEEAEDD